MSPSIVRTLVPLIVGALLGWAARIGLDLPSGAVTEIVTVSVTFAYYTAARLIETQWPAIGRWLLAAGITGQSPVYVPAATAQRLTKPPTV
ncbi:hypothetical protein [Actinomadura rudentiformis]|uniref:Uncharacterized protein n=1 Tax=Actinomadura rudentiformis TaxID=359158 RepID=A0A6H9YN98_9ACTN|nr:hypothetical protein [Actinomadura rudentiformis]KAB2344895.1 hypothetical protein F8566_30360 [Actinomadura rudentiformis]